MNSESLNQARCEGYRRTHRNLSESLNIVTHYGAEAITPTELLRNDSDPYKAVVTKRLELTGQLERLEKRIEEECPPEGITIFPKEGY